ncbi:CLUMA_CG012443, isoform A [Clunio marinus]|uniref:CLUMA_CG012443, isoform A n=1 Tax=Clunio marinus TaxID=568069 RepID=A0A1J1IEM4_9DIPT|nr:CLUMA_CG012443, isoform A [Clunio marinus]
MLNTKTEGMKKKCISNRLRCIRFSFISSCVNLVICSFVVRSLEHQPFLQPMMNLSLQKHSICFCK